MRFFNEICELEQAFPGSTIYIDNMDADLYEVTRVDADCILHHSEASTLNGAVIGMLNQGEVPYA